MIPKIIHYCWFGGKPLPKLAEKCIRSWKKFLPDYEIKRWDESNFDVRRNAYVSEAYDARKFAFVSDFARYWILFNEGGVYLDTDVELVRPIDDIIASGAFMGCERKHSPLYAPAALGVNTGLGFAAPKGMPFIAEMLGSYEYRRFVLLDGSLDLTTVVQVTSDMLCRYGLKNVPDIQSVAGFNIYPQDYFNPMQGTERKVVLTENTRSIHHADASWQTPYIRFKKNFRAFLGPSIMGCINRFRNLLKK